MTIFQFTTAVQLAYNDVHQWLKGRHDVGNNYINHAPNLDSDDPTDVAARFQKYLHTHAFKVQSVSTKFTPILTISSNVDDSKLSF